MIQALLEIKSLTKLKDVLCLTGRIAALNRSVARTTNKSFPFFKVLKKGAKFVWIDDFEHSFQELKTYLEKLQSCPSRLWEKL